MSQSNGTFTHTIPDPESLSDFRRLIRERNRAARLRHKLIESSEEINDLDVIIVDLEEERDGLGEQLDMVLGCLAVLMNHIEDTASRFDNPRENLRENLKGYLKAEQILDAYGYNLAPSSVMDGDT